MINPFEGKAVKFDTAEQLKHLADLANDYDLNIGACEFMPNSYFRSNRISKGYYETFSIPKPTDTVIHYSDFIKGIEAAESDHSEQHPDMVNHPPIDVIAISQKFNLNYTVGCALDCLLKNDIEKAIWYLQRENDKSK